MDMLAYRVVMRGHESIIEGAITVKGHYVGVQGDRIVIERYMGDGTEVPVFMALAADVLAVHVVDPEEA